jgi:hypothetical protein
LIGLALFLAAYALSRSSWRALVLAGLIQAGNEVNDYTVKGSRDFTAYLIDTAYDTAWTLALPLGLTVIALVIHHRRKKG